MKSELMRHHRVLGQVEINFGDCIDKEGYRFKNVKTFKEGECETRSS